MNAQIPMSKGGTSHLRACRLLAFGLVWLCAFALARHGAPVRETEAAFSHRSCAAMAEATGEGTSTLWFWHSFVIQIMVYSLPFSDNRHDIEVHKINLNYQMTENQLLLRKRTGSKI